MIEKVYVTLIVVVVVVILIAYLTWNFNSNNKGQENARKKASNTEQKHEIVASIKVLNFIEFAVNVKQSLKSQK